MTLLVLAACNTPDQKKEFDVAPVPPPSAALEMYTTEIDSILSSMSLEDKMGELIWLDIRLDKDLKDKISIPHVGYANTTIKQYKNIHLDTSKRIAYFSNDPYQMFFDTDLPFQPKDLNTIADTLFWSRYFTAQQAYFKREQIQAICFDPKDDLSGDSTFSLEVNKWIEEGLLVGGKLDSLYPITRNGILGQKIAMIYNADSVPELSDTICRYYLRHEEWTDTIGQVVIQKVLLGKYDGFHLKVSNEEQLVKWLLWLAGGDWKSYVDNDLLDFKVRKAIALKLWSNSFEDFLPDNRLETELKGVAYESRYKGISLIKNKLEVLPLKDLPEKKWKFISVGDENRKSFLEGMDHYASISSVSQKISNFSLSGLSADPVVILLDNQKIDSVQMKQFVKAIKSTEKHCVVVNIGHPEHLGSLAELPTVIQVWNAGGGYGNHLAQLIVGGVGFLGGVPNGAGVKALKTKKTRLAYSIPEEVGIAADSLKKMDKIAAEAVWGGATPGCQVFVAKNGKVIFNKGFGYRTYLQKHKVTTETTYDIASVTKVAATTMMGMHLYDKGKYGLNDSLKLHLPDSLQQCLGHFSRLSNVTFQRLFTHTSGLPAGLPIYKYMMYVDSNTGRWDKYYCDEPNRWFKVEVAKNFYMDSAYLDSLWLATNNIWTGTKEYKYSDANMNVLYQIFRSKLKKGQKYEKYLDSVFYHPLGMDGTAFLPRKNLDTLQHPLTPTENETYWRKQLIHGYVHDPNAAMFGGVAGNAGLFSNANDLGVLMWMLMNKGAYGGRQFLQSATVKKFTLHQEGSHRGLGFDKPTASSGNVVAPDCPYTAYGHTGFTGICVWNDPENDLVFVFTSNRVHPNANNKKLITFGVRKRLHQVIYDQLYYNGSYKNEQTKDVPLTRNSAETKVS